MFSTIIAQGVKFGNEFGSPFGSTTGAGSQRGFGDLLTLIIQFSIVVAGVVLVFLLVGGGLQMIRGAGSNDPKTSAAGQQAITAAIGGFILVLFAYIIIRIIETIVGNDFLTAPIFNPGGGPSV